MTEYYCNKKGGENGFFELVGLGWAGFGMEQWIGNYYYWVCVVVQSATGMPSLYLNAASVFECECECVHACAPVHLLLIYSSLYIFFYISFP